VTVFFGTLIDPGSLGTGPKLNTTRWIIHVSSVTGQLLPSRWTRWGFQLKHPGIVPVIRIFWTSRVPVQDFGFFTVRLASNYSNELRLLQDLMT
jgi:hypothetical protein